MSLTDGDHSSLRLEISSDSEKSQRSNPLIRSSAPWLTTIEASAKGLLHFAPSLPLRCYVRNDGYSPFSKAKKVTTNLKINTFITI